MERDKKKSPSGVAILGAVTGIAGTAIALLSLVWQILQSRPVHDLAATVADSFAMPTPLDQDLVRVRADVALRNDGHAAELISDAAFYASNCPPNLPGAAGYFIGVPKKPGPLTIESGGKSSIVLQGSFSAADVRRILTLQALRQTQFEKCHASMKPGSFWLSILLSALEPNGHLLGVLVPVGLMNSTLQYKAALNKTVLLVPATQGLPVDPYFLQEELNRMKSDYAKKHAGDGSD